VRTLRDCESAGLTVSWNWLYGFPGETLEQYAPVMSQIPALSHLQPPAGAARIFLERFSPYFENEALGFTPRTTASAYRHVYALAEADLADMVYLFDTVPRGLTEQEAADLHRLVAAWSRGYTDSTLECLPDEGGLVLRDRRVGWPASDHRIEDPALRAAYRELGAGRSVHGLLGHLAEDGVQLSEDRLTGWLGQLREQGLVFTENGQWISLATTTVPIKVVTA